MARTKLTKAKKDGSGKKGVKKPSSNRMDAIKEARKRRIQDIENYKRMKNKPMKPKNKIPNTPLEKKRQAEMLKKNFKKKPQKLKDGSRMKDGGVAKKAAGGMMSPQPMPTMRRRPPISMPPRPPKTPVRKAPAKRPPGGGRPNPPAASKAVPNLDPAMMAKIRSMLLAENRKLGSSNSSKPVAKKISGSSGSGESQKDQPSEVSKVKKKFKGPGMKDGGVAKKMGGGMMYKKNGGAVGSSKKGGGMAIRGLGKAFKNSKR